MCAQKKSNKSNKSNKKTYKKSPYKKLNQKINRLYAKLDGEVKKVD